MNNLPIQTYESVVQQRDALEKKLADMAAESAALNKFIKDDCWVWDDKNETYFDAIDGIPETQATDAFTRELMAKGVEDAAGSLFGAGYPFDLLMGYVAQLRKGINDAQ
ncbi:hypothetical protein [Hafnia paralvei]|uniref:hypothetical protein n=1 Tax=Hafnia paralvei TaxID=546367 RepID=UPI0024B9CD5E|nr:hypothetical protein [Hafnia paralvei]